MKEYISVSLVIPVRNEEHYIVACMESILNQSYPKDKMEILFVDGASTDKTKDTIASFAQDHGLEMIVLDNPKRIAPVAMNIGIRVAKHDILVRLDAHSAYPATYVEDCVKTLLSTGADNAGGLVRTRGKGPIGRAFSQVLSSKFGVGNSGFRTNAQSGFTDTVPFGAFRREAFEKYGLYDERLCRNQDYELNQRIRKNGGKIYLNADIVLDYFCRNTLSGICKQSFENGKWNVITNKLCPGSMSVRHFIPLAFVLSVIGLSIISIFLRPFAYLLLLELGLYTLLDVVFSFKNADPGQPNPWLLKLILFPLFHISYGIGSLYGLVSMHKYK